MYDMGSFMKILKQWFTEEYNRRSAHVGTLWESTYIDRSVTLKSVDMSNVLAYICLNPIRGGLCADYDEYAWSSLCAATRGDPLAINGLKFVYGEEKSVAEMVEALHCQMDTGLLFSPHLLPTQFSQLCKKGFGAFHPFQNTNTPNDLRLVNLLAFR